MLKRAVLKLTEIVVIVAITVSVIMVISDVNSPEPQLFAGVTDTGEECSSARFPSADPDGNDGTSILDALYILEYLFLGGPEPVPVCDAGGAELPCTDEQFDTLCRLADCIEMVSVPDPQDDTIEYETVRFTGCNVQIVNGSGATNGDDGLPYATVGFTDGLGNLIIGYNEQREVAVGEDPLDFRTGIHNIIMGQTNNYTSFGGFIAGRTGEITAAYATISGGFENFSEDPMAAVCGGCTNTATGLFSVAVGGRNNIAASPWSVVVGGGGDPATTDDPENTAAAPYSVVVGGLRNVASSGNAVVVGGAENEASGFGSVVVGGGGLEDPVSLVSPGNEASGAYSVVVAGILNEATGGTSVVSGGNDNVASAVNSTVGGGTELDAEDADGYVDPDTP